MDDVGDWGTGPLDEFELHTIRNRWTARAAQAPRSLEEAELLLDEAQRDLGRLLHHVGVFGGPPVIDE